MNLTNSNNILICIEGPDFSGKSTFLNNFKIENEDKYLFFREPGSLDKKSFDKLTDKSTYYEYDFISKKYKIKPRKLKNALQIRSIVHENDLLRDEVLHKEYSSIEKLDLLVHARENNLNLFSEIYKNHSNVIITDRFFPSTFVYQTKDMPGNMIDVYHRWIFKKMELLNIKMYTIIFTVDEPTYMYRKSSRQEFDLIEKETMRFPYTILYGYRDYVEKYKNETVIRIDANKSIEEVYEDVSSLINKIITGGY